jgi:hypothetical protein
VPTDRFLDADAWPGLLTRHCAEGTQEKLDVTELSVTRRKERSVLSEPFMVRSAVRDA